MRRADLAPAVRARLVRYPPPHHAHDGVVPAPPPETGPGLGSVIDRLAAATAPIARVQVYAEELADPYMATRILSRPVVTIKRLSGLLGVAYGQAATAAEQLRAAGILAERTGYARNRVFVAHEALAILNRPFGEPPILPGED